MVYYSDSNGTLHEVPKVCVKDPNSTSAILASKLVIDGHTIDVNDGEWSVFEWAAVDALTVANAPALAHNINTSSGRFNITIPVSGTYRITLVGRGGYSYSNKSDGQPTQVTLSSGGSGAFATREIALEAGTALTIYNNTRIRRTSGSGTQASRLSVSIGSTAICVARDGSDGISGSAGAGGQTVSGDWTTTAGNNGNRIYLPNFQEEDEYDAAAGNSVDGLYGKYGEGESVYINYNGAINKYMYGNRSITGLVRIERISQ